MTTSSITFGSVTVQVAHPQLHWLGLHLFVGARQPGSLNPEAVRALHAWLGWWLDGQAGDPPAQDELRAVAAEQHAELIAMHRDERDPRVSSGLAWGVSALEKVLAVGGRVREYPEAAR